MFGSTIVVVLSRAEAAVVVTAVVEALALRVLALAGKGPLLFVAALGCSFLFNLLLHDLRSFCHRLSPGQVLWHET
jgi:hypothetical protein